MGVKEAPCGCFGHLPANAKAVWRIAGRRVAMKIKRAAASRNSWPLKAVWLSYLAAGRSLETMSAANRDGGFLT